MLHALEKDRNRRYRTADDFAADIRRYLAGEPIRARPASLFYQLRLLAKRHKTTFAAAGVGVASLVVLIVGMSYMLRSVAAAQRTATTLFRLANSRVTTELLRARAEVRLPLFDRLEDDERPAHGGRIVQFTPGHDDQPSVLNNAAGALVAAKGSERDHDACLKALAWAEQAITIHDERCPAPREFRAGWYPLSTLAMARFRSGELSQAEDTLRECLRVEDRLHGVVAGDGEQRASARATFGSHRAIDMAFLAMTLAHSGRTDEAP